MPYFIFYHFPLASLKPLPPESNSPSFWLYSFGDWYTEEPGGLQSTGSQGQTRLKQTRTHITLSRLSVTPRCRGLDNEWKL